MRLAGSLVIPLLRGLGADVLAFCYPGRCAACEASCESEMRLCPRCTEQLGVMRALSACCRCAMPTGPGGCCPYCLGRGLRPYTAIAGLGLYRPPLRTLIHRLKYERGWTLGEDLADWLWERRAVREMLAGAEALVPVPLHWRRQLGRGFNQAELLARRLGQRSGRPVIQPLRRLRHTPSQTVLTSNAARQENLRGAVALRRPDWVEARRLVVVDDVLTSGATLQTVGRLLASAKAAELSALIIARADPQHRDFQGV